MDQLKKYSKYNLWANTLVLDKFVSQVPEALLDKEVPNSFPSLRKTVYHIWDAETIWLNRLERSGVSVLPIVHEQMNYDEFKLRIISTSEKLMNLIVSKNHNWFEEKLTYKNSEGKEFTNPVIDIVHHVFNHSTYHRGQCVTLLRELGVTSLGSTDFITYCRLFP